MLKLRLNQQAIGRLGLNTRDQTLWEEVTYFSHKVKWVYNQYHTDPMLKDAWTFRNPPNPHPPR